MKTNRQYVPFSILFIYVVVNVYVAVLNWDLFSTVLNIDMGFGVVVMPIFFIQFLFGLILMLVFWFIEYRKDLKHQISFLENESKIKIQQKDFEIENLKTKKPQHIDMKDKSDNKIKPVSFATTNKLVEK